MSTNPESAHLLCEEVLAQARKEAEEILSRGREEAATVLAGAEAKAKKTKEEQLQRAREEADRQRDMIRATVAVETGRMRSERLETLLGSVHDEALKKLHAKEGFAYKDTLVVLASGAIERMGGDAFVVWVSEEDRDALGDGLAPAIAKAASRPVDAVRVSYTPDFKGGGLVVEDGDGRRTWDNRFAKRLERMWPDLRRRIAIKASFIPAPGSEEESP